MTFTCENDALGFAMVRRRDGMDLLDELEGAERHTLPEVRLMRPSGVTRHSVSGTTITFGKTFRFAGGTCLYFISPFSPYLLEHFVDFEMTSLKT